MNASGDVSATAPLTIHVEVAHPGMFCSTHLCVLIIVVFLAMLKYFNTSRASGKIYSILVAVFYPSISMTSSWPSVTWQEDTIYMVVFLMGFVLPQ